MGFSRFLSPIYSPAFNTLRPIFFFPQYWLTGFQYVTPYHYMAFHVCQFHVCQKGSFSLSCKNGRETFQNLRLQFTYWVGGLAVEPACAFNLLIGWGGLAVEPACASSRWRAEPYFFPKGGLYHWAAIPRTWSPPGTLYSPSTGLSIHASGTPLNHI